MCRPRSPPRRRWKPGRAPRPAHSTDSISKGILRRGPLLRGKVGNTPDGYYRSTSSTSGVFAGTVSVSCSEYVRPPITSRPVVAPCRRSDGLNHQSTRDTPQRRWLAQGATRESAHAPRRRRPASRGRCMLHRRTHGAGGGTRLYTPRWLSRKTDVLSRSWGALMCEDVHKLLPPIVLGGARPALRMGV